MTKTQAALVSVWLPHVSEADHVASLAEMTRLASTLGIEVAHTVTQRRGALAPAAVLGEGRLKDLALLTGGSGIIPSGAMRKVTKATARESQEPSDASAVDPLDPEDPDDQAWEPGAASGTPDDPASPVTLVIVDNEISPAQIRNLEKATGVEVLDRSGVIIEIFHRHARTREARLQVELARLAYEAPRLREKPSRGDRQRAGSVGGSGESDLELDRRRIRDRMAVVRRELEAVGVEQAGRRARRRSENKVALVGYTNAGKSSLMRALTGSDVLVADQLFATLGTTVRHLAGDARPPILVSDTVGFIKSLPHDLVASFRSTLDEAHDASLLLFVVDASDPAFRSQLQVTQDVLKDIGVHDTPKRLVLNKCDQLTLATLQELATEFPDAIQMSTRVADQVAAMAAMVQVFFEKDWVEADFSIPYTAQSIADDMHEQTRVVTQEYDENGVNLHVRGPQDVLARFSKRLAAAVPNLNSTDVAP